ncbi:urease accessory protein UreD [Celerinatantimonas sp. MCCC 1A17872]|uniref:urease accessory protein UreD n=1 Tax=Celerinatantimonas sp. MCCC 1A17872 TaxID=3177514 RepID=UPI0038C907B8
MTSSALASPTLNWPASLELKLALTQRGNRLIHNRHQGPLYVQKPFYPEGPDCAHLYLLHPPGGIVSGDELNIDIAQQSSGHALVTTPGAARVYKGRADQSTQAQHVNLHLEPNASIEWLPMETLIYPGSNSSLSQSVYLSENSQYLGWEIACLGLVDCQQPFTKGHYCQALKIYRNNRLKLHDRLVVAGSDEPQSLMHSPLALNGYPIHGLLVATADNFTTNELKVLREISEPFEQSAENQVGITQINDILIVRFLGQHSETCRQLFTQIWQHLRPLMINKVACAPRIWRT